MTTSTRSSPRPRPPALVHLAQRHQTLLRQIGEIGPVLRGTIGTYRTQCGTSGCHCHTDPDARHGPYYIWTRKVSGKTVTRMLSPEQANLLRPWTDNMRRLDRLVTALQNSGRRAAEALRSVR